MPDVKGLRLLRHGLFLGEVKKNRFEPSQSLAMYLKKNQFDNVVDLQADDIRVIKYLKGETIELDTESADSVDSGMELKMDMFLSVWMAIHLAGQRITEAY